MHRVSASILLSVAMSVVSRAQDRASSWKDGGGYRWKTLNVASAPRVGFTQLASSATAISFTNRLSEASIAANRVLANGSGVAVGDYDNDGLPDIYFCGLESNNVLYRNLGNWKFQDVTAESGIVRPEKMSRGAVFADLNGDGFLDLFVSTVGQGVLCFINDGHGKFNDQTASAGLRSQTASMTLALADVDGNGTLDLYVANNQPDDLRDRGRLNVPVVKGKPVIPAQLESRVTLQDGQILFYGQPDQLFLNNGAGHFRAASWADGTFLDEAGQKLSGGPRDWGLTATFRDVNNDRAPDLYVCNDYWTPDRFWINDGHGRFRAADKLALRQISSSSMGVDLADVDRDGTLDLFVVDMLSRDPRLKKRQAFADKPSASTIGAIDNRPQVFRNTFFRNRGDGTFAEMAYFAGLVASDWSWSPIFIDVDLDGYEDLLISAGHFRDVQDLDAAAQIKARQHPWTNFTDEAERQKAYTRELMEHYRLYPALNMPVVAFRNSGRLNFEETTPAWGLDHPAIHHGMALGDFDQDGDLDLVVNVLNGPAAIYRNDSSAGRIAVKLKGMSSNTQAIGAKVRLLNGAVPNQTTEIISGGHYLAASEAIAVFATGKATSGMRLEIQWRAGTTSIVEGVEPNRLYEIDEKLARRIADDASRTKAAETASKTQPMFKDVSAALAHTHVEPEFNDFERQPLLPFKLSQPGPGVAWFDLDGDGKDELIAGAGAGNPPSVFKSDDQGKFIRIDVTGIRTVSSDLSGIVGYADSNGRALIAGLTGYEAAATNAAVQYRLANGRLEQGDAIAPEISNGGALALGDLNGDGNLVLFVAGGVRPGRYPIGAPSKIYRGASGKWQLDPRNSSLLDNLGIVNGAVWSDLTGDGIPELVLACEWGPLRILQNRTGLLFDVTKDFGLDKYKGWWKGISTGDLDGDGRLDIVASNWGLNSPYAASESRPLTFFYGEISQPGVTEVIETEHDRIANALAPRRSLMALAASMPFLLEQVPSHRSFSEATLDQVLGPRRPLARSVAATTLASMVFLNRGDRFEGIILPMEAQLAPAFAVNIADFDNDGHEDVFLSQNFFATHPEMSRLDASRGLWLRGTGTGHLSPMPGEQCGLLIYGEQRGAAVGDFDEDGRVDLVVAQNGAATKLFQNTGSAVGLRVRLQGPPGNPTGAGAVLRVQSSGRLGPAREIHAGSGYWSQDSSIQVLALPASAESIWIRWPGGKTTSTLIPAATRELTIDVNGTVVRRR